MGKDQIESCSGACLAACGAQQAGGKPHGERHGALDPDPHTQMNPDLIWIGNSD